MGPVGCHGKSANPTPGAAPRLTGRPSRLSRAPTHSAPCCRAGELPDRPGRSGLWRLAAPAGPAAYTLAGSGGAHPSRLPWPPAAVRPGLIENGRPSQSEAMPSRRRASGPNLGRAGAGAERWSPEPHPRGLHRKVEPWSRDGPRSAVVDLWVDGARRRAPADARIVLRAADEPQSRPTTAEIIEARADAIPGWRRPTRSPAVLPGDPDTGGLADRLDNAGRGGVSSAAGAKRGAA
jgi:hypothetical protein